MKSTYAGLDFIRRHMLVDCPKNDSLRTISRKTQHLYLPFNLDDELDFIKSLLEESGIKVFTEELQRQIRLIARVYPTLRMIREVIVEANELRPNQQESLLGIYTGVKSVGDYPETTPVLCRDFVNLPVTPRADHLVRLPSESWSKWEKYISTPILEGYGTPKQIATEFAQFLEEHKRDINFLFKNVPQGSILEEQVLKPFFLNLSSCRSIANATERKAKIKLLIKEAIKEILNKQPKEMPLGSEQLWNAYEAVETMQIVSPQKMTTEHLKTSAAAFLKLVMGEVPDDQVLNMDLGLLKSDPSFLALGLASVQVTAESRSKLLVIRDMAMRCLGDAECTLKGSMVMLNRAGLLPAPDLRDLWPRVEVPKQSLARWFEDRVAKYSGELFKDTNSTNTNPNFLVRMVLDGLAKIRKRLEPEVPSKLAHCNLGQLDHRLDSLEAMLIQYAWSYEYAWMCANKILIDSMGLGDLIMLYPGCSNHAMAVIVDRRGEDEYRYHLLNSGGGLNNYHDKKTEPGGKAVYLPVATYVINRQVLSEMMAWSSSYWKLNLLDDDSLIYPPAEKRIKEPFHSEITLYTKSQEAGTCLAKSIRLAIQFLMGEPFYRLLKAEMASLWLIPLLSSILATENFTPDVSKKFLQRWGLETKAHITRVRSLVTLNYLLSLAERSFSSYAEAESKSLNPRWLVILNTAILETVQAQTDSLQARPDLLSSELIEILKLGINQLLSKAIQVKSFEAAPLTTLEYGAALSWCGMPVYHPFLFGYQPFLGHKTPAEEYWRVNCGLNPEIKNNLAGRLSESAINKLKQIQAGQVTSLQFKFIEDYRSTTQAEQLVSEQDSFEDEFVMVENDKVQSKPQGGGSWWFGQK